MPEAVGPKVGRSFKASGALGAFGGSTSGGGVGRAGSSQAGATQGKSAGVFARCVDLSEKGYIAKGVNFFERKLKIARKDFSVGRWSSGT